MQMAEMAAILDAENNDENKLRLMFY